MIKHCLTCGCTHDDNECCSPNAFVLIRCSCGNESLMPCDAAMMGMSGCQCGQCGKDTDWKSSTPTVEDMKRHWKDYGENINEIGLHHRVV